MAGLRKGLPERARMRHDAHFVEELSTSSGGTQVGFFLALDRVEPNPDQPRTQLGSLEELTASIQSKGVLEPILVRSAGNGRYQIISGERRFHASIAAGLDEIPAIEIEADDRETLEIALIENIQRKDLTPFEEADALGILEARFGFTHERIASVIGKSRTTVTETLAIGAMPPSVKERCLERGITAKSVLVQIARAGSEEAMLAAIELLARGGAARENLRRATAKQAEKKAGRPRNFTFTFKEKGSPFMLNLKFRKPEASREDVISALRSLIEKLERE